MKKGMLGLRLEPWLWGGAATILFWLGSWVPSFWSDEAATRSAVSRSWSELALLVNLQDAVHAPYYALLKVWTSVVGSTEPWALRFPSVVAAGLTVTAVWLLARRHLGVVGARTAAIIAMALPALAYASTEARSAAVVTMTITWSWVALDSALSGRRKAWFAYFALLALSSLLFLFSSIVAVAQGLSILLDRSRRRQIGRWAVAVAGAAVIVLPLAWVASGQTRQISWIRRPTVASIRNGLLMQWFPFAPWFAITLILVVVAGAIKYAMFSAESKPNAESKPLDRRWLTITSISWLVIPTFILLTVSIFIFPIYHWRYLIWTAPAWAIIAASAIWTFKPWRRVVILVLLGITAVVPFITTRMPAAATKSPITNVRLWSSFTQPFRPVQGTVDWNAAAATIRLHSSPGDSVVFVPDEEFPSPRLIMESYPRMFAGLNDIGLEVVGSDVGRLWSRGRPLTVEDFHRPGVLWILALRGDDTVETLATKAGVQLELVFDGTQTLVFRHG